MNVQHIDHILVSTDDPVVEEIARSFADTKIVIDQRPSELAQSSTPNDLLMSYVPKVIKDGHVIFTHVTSPFVESYQYDQSLREYSRAIKSGYDSLMSVTRLQSYIWDENSPVNYDRGEEKWPKTQTLTPFYEVNSAIFIASIKIYKTYNDRIGEKPYLYEMGKIVSYDIDWEDEFEVAEAIWKSQQHKSTII